MKFELILAVVGAIRGSLGIATVAASAIFGVMSGSSVACVAAIGKLTVPALRKNGYGDRFSSSLVTATGVISSLLINIVFLWAMALLLVPMANVTAASILIFVGVGFFQPGLTRLLTYKGIDTLGVAITELPLSPGRLSALIRAPAQPRS